MVPLPPANATPEAMILWAISLLIPGIWEHEVTEVKEGDRWVLSIGWVSGRRWKAP